MQSGMASNDIYFLSIARNIGLLPTMWLILMLKPLL